MSDALIFLLFAIILTASAHPRGVGRWLAGVADGYDDMRSRLEAEREARRWESKP